MKKVLALIVCLMFALSVNAAFAADKAMDTKAPASTEMKADDKKMDDKKADKADKKIKKHKKHKKHHKIKKAKKAEKTDEKVEPATK